LSLVFSLVLWLARWKLQPLVLRAARLQFRPPRLFESKCPRRRPMPCGTDKTGFSLATPHLTLRQCVAGKENSRSRLLDGAGHESLQDQRLSRRAWRSRSRRAHGNGFGRGLVAANVCPDGCERDHAAKTACDHRGQQDQAGAHQAVDIQLHPAMPFLRRRVTQACVTLALCGDVGDVNEHVVSLCKAQHQALCVSPVPLMSSMPTLTLSRLPHSDDAACRSRRHDLSMRVYDRTAGWDQSAPLPNASPHGMAGLLRAKSRALADKDDYA
jgi:hypothetical protein